ncbi:MAG: DMT family transporter [Nitrospinae bacterium]|nr:DMT family transporter [Nitrospinota bacterium]
MIQMISAVLLFAFGPILLKMAMNEGIGPDQVVVLRLAVAFPSFLAAVVVSRSLAASKPSFKEIPFLFFISVFAMGGAMICFVHSVMLLGASVAALIGATQPVMTALIAYFALSRPVTSRQALSIAASFLGVFFIVIPMTGLLGLEKMLGVSPAGVGYSILSTVCAAAASLGFEKYVEGKKPLVASFQVTGMMLFFLAGAYGAPQLHFTTRIWTIAVMLGVVTWFLPFMLLFYGIREMGASGASLVQNLGPVVTVLAAGVIFGERLAPAQMVGMTMVLSSVFILAWERKLARQGALNMPEA